MHRGAKTAAGRLRWMCRTGAGTSRKYCYSSTEPAAARAQSGRRFDAPEQERTFRRKLRKGVRTFIITAAQNATPIHPEFWACLQQVVKHKRAELIVQPLRYKNPTSRWTASQANEEIWAVETIPYLWNSRLRINENLVLLADAKVQPTASDPLAGFDALSGSSSAILGHTKMALRSIATPSNKLAKIITTTGACTIANFTDSRAGAQGNFHHSLAALIVEVKGRKFFLRQLYYDRPSESITDLTTRYHVGHIDSAPRPLALVLGDSHVGSVDPGVESATFGKGGIVETLRPQHLIFHDLFDGLSCNPHETNNPFASIAKNISGRSNVADEVRQACEYVRDRTSEDTKGVVVSSNHNNFLSRWISSHDWKSDPTNARFYLETALEMVKETKMVPGGYSCPNPLTLAFPKIVDTSNIKLLNGDESFVLGGCELSLHGDRGPNGARGSAKNLRRIGIRSIVGHSHAPCIEEGVFQCGTSSLLRLSYNSGPSSWLQAHTILHASGKRQLVIIVDGRWRG